MLSIIHYSEIALKGKNRRYFENLLLSNIKKSLKDIRPIKLFLINGRIILDFPDNQEGLIKNKLKKICGIRYFGLGFKVKKNLGIINRTILKFIKNKKFKSFKIDANRVFKEDILTSIEVNKKVGAYIKEKTNKEVDLEDPDLTCFIELLKDEALIYFEKIDGVGGLPTSSAGKIAILISGGIDSPVAAYKLIKRGAKLIFIHFHSYPSTSKASQEKVISLIKILNEYQLESKIYMVPFLEVQKYLIKNIPKKYLIIFYRRFMLKIAEKIAKKEKCLALATGDSLGQVASQTLENIFVISEITEMPIFRPLIGDDKEDIINLAKEIGTFQISILPHEDCCVFYVPEHPETRANLNDVLKIEKSLKIKSLLSKAVKNAKIFYI